MEDFWAGADRHAKCDRKTKEYINVWSSRWWKQFMQLLEKKPKKNSGFNEIRTHDLCDAGAMLYQLSYEARMVSWSLCWVNNSQMWYIYICIDKVVWTAVESVYKCMIITVMKAIYAIAWKETRKKIRASKESQKKCYNMNSNLFRLLIKF